MGLVLFLFKIKGGYIMKQLSEILTNLSLKKSRRHYDDIVGAQSTKICRNIRRRIRKLIVPKGFMFYVVIKIYKDDCYIEFLTSCEYQYICLDGTVYDSIDNSSIEENFTRGENLKLDVDKYKMSSIIKHDIIQKVEQYFEKYETKIIPEQINYFTEFGEEFDCGTVIKFIVN